MGESDDEVMDDQSRVAAPVVQSLVDVANGDFRFFFAASKEGEDEAVPVCRPDSSTGLAHCVGIGGAVRKY